MKKVKCPQCERMCKPEYSGLRKKWLLEHHNDQNGNRCSGSYFVVR